MCDFISWIEKGAGKNKQILFLTADDLASKRGKELKDHCQRKEDWVGHGAIRWFYNFRGGHERECVDFTSPTRFPKEIVAAIKAGQFKGMAPFPEGLLLAPLYADYQAKRNALDADYQAKWAPLDNEQWELFKNPDNRAEAWRRALVCHGRWISR